MRIRMALTTAETRRLAEIRAEIDELSAAITPANALGDSNSSQGISATWDIKWRVSRRDYLRKIRDMLEAKEADEPIPPAPGVNLSYYRPESGRYFL